MNKILTAEVPDSDLEAEVEKVSAQYPAELKDSVINAYQAADGQNFETAVELCQELLDYKAVPEIRALLGTCCFMKNDLHKAEAVFSKLVRDCPEAEEYHIYHGLVNHALGRYEEAVKELEKLYPLSTYQPFYYSCYGDCLQGIGRLKQSRDAFYQEAAYFQNTGIIVSSHMLDGSFENLLYLDIFLGNGEYSKDIELYYDFLEKVEMTHEMQENLAGNIVYLCSLMSNKWYRPLFLEFINHIKERGYLTDSGPLETLESAFVSWESFMYHEDRKICALMESFLSNEGGKKYSEEYMSEEEQALIGTYEWYMCQYAENHPAEIEYVKETYPYTYANVREFLEKIKADRDGMSKKLLDELHQYAHGISRQKFDEYMMGEYRKVCKNEKYPAYVYDGEDTYRRIQPKVGRNDPCPCGSGKKYKKCCGK